MLKVCIYDDGRITKETVDSLEAKGWMHSKYVGGFYSINSEDSSKNCEVIFIDGDKKSHHLKRVFNKNKKEINDKIRKLKEEKKAMDDMLKSVIESV